MKKLLSFLLAIILIVSAVPLGAFVVSADDNQYTEGYYTYTVSDGKATITSVDTSINGDITIPNTLGGYPVTSIGERAFYKCTSLTSIIIPYGVTSMGDRAFYECTILTSIIIPDGVTSIGDYPFYYCASLTDITIPDSVTSIGGYVSWGCTGLANITVDPNNDYYCSIDGVLFNKDASTLIEYPIGKTDTSYIIPDGVTSIGYGAFYNCMRPTSITIPDSVTNIGDYAFYNCTSLSDITIPDGVTSIGNSAFSGGQNVTNFTNISVDPNNDYYCSIDGVLFNKDATTLIQYPIGKTDISYIIPDSVTSISSYAFNLCTRLTNITIPDGVINISNNAFSHCNIIDIIIPDGITYIGNYAFNGCRNLISVNIPDSITGIGWGAFSYCTSLKSVYYGGSEKDKNNIFIMSNNESLTNATWYYNSCIDSTTHTFNNICDKECDICGFTRTVEHTFTDACDAECDICYETRKPPHIYDDKNDTVCNLCGAQKPAVKSGDINDDDKINNKDLGLLMQYINKWPIEINIDAADVNKDTKINNKDYGILAQYINKWDVELQ